MSTVADTTVDNGRKRSRSKRKGHDGEKRRRRKSRKRTEDEEVVATQDVPTSLEDADQANSDKSIKPAGSKRGRKKKKDDETKPKTPQQIKRELAKKKARARKSTKDLGIGEDQKSFVKQMVKNIQKRAERNAPRRSVMDDSITLLDNLREYTVQQIIKSAELIHKTSKKKTFTTNLAISSVRQAFPATLTQAAIRRAQKALESLKASIDEDKASKAIDEGDETRLPSKTIETRTGLFLKVSRIKRTIKDKFPTVRKNAAVVVAAATEVMIEMIALLTIKLVEETKPRKLDKNGRAKSLGMITSRDIRDAVVSNTGDVSNLVDNGLKHFFRNALWTECGARIDPSMKQYLRSNGHS